MKEIYLEKYNTYLNVQPNVNMTEFGHIYLIENLTNGKKYVGQSIRVRERISEHIRNMSRGIKHTKDHPLYKAFLKYGLNSFEFTIIDSANNINELNDKEISTIKEFKSNIKEFGYNLNEGGLNALTTPETRKKLSEARANVVQTREWIDKRIDAVGKPVLMINSKTNQILERFRSLADAGRLNSAGISYENISTRCLGKVKNQGEFIFCYEEDYLNGTIKEYKPLECRSFLDATEEELNEISNEFLSGASIHSIADKYKFHYSTVEKYLKDKQKKENVLDLNCLYCAVCKSTGKKFEDFTNKSGALTIHLTKLGIEIPGSQYLRKKIENQTGKFWYYEYFDFILI